GRTTMRKAWVLVPGLLATLVGCGTPPDAVDVEADEEGKFDSAKRVSLSAGHDVTVRIKGTGGARQVAVDCRPSSKPDSTTGVSFSVDAPTLGTKASDPDRAGFWRAIAVLSSGTHELTLLGQSGSGSCTVSVQKVSGQCTQGSAWHSPNPNHTHIAV